MRKNARKNMRTNLRKFKRGWRSIGQRVQLDRQKSHSGAKKPFWCRRTFHQIFINFSFKQTYRADDLKYH